MCVCVCISELAHQVSILPEHRSTAHLESLLMELREQEERNEETLQQLAEQLHVLHYYKYVYVYWCLSVISQALRCSHHKFLFFTLVEVPIQQCDITTIFIFLKYISTKQLDNILNVLQMQKGYFQRVRFFTHVCYWIVNVITDVINIDIISNAMMCKQHCDVVVWG